jgi:hypothetical protein
MLAKQKWSYFVRLFEPLWNSRKCQDEQHYNFKPFRWIFYPHLHLKTWPKHTLALIQITLHIYKTLRLIHIGEVFFIKNRCHESQHNDIQYNYTQHKGIICFIHRVDIQQNDTRCSTTAIVLNVILLSVLFYLFLCWMSSCWVSLCWVSWRLIITRDSDNGITYLGYLGDLALTETIPHFGHVTQGRYGK